MNAPAKTNSNRGITGWLTNFGFALVCILLPWWGLIYLLQNRVLFPRGMASPPFSKVPYAHAVLRLRELEPNEYVEAWFVPAQGATATQPRPLVVFFHGNAEIIDQQDYIVENYRKLGYHILLPEYRGYGKSVGEPSQVGIREDAAYFIEKILADTPSIDADKIIYHGRSVGGGVAADLIAVRPPAALILESTPSSIAMFVRKYFAPQWLIKNPFRTDQAINNSELPILILHGRDDTIIPVSHAHRLHQLAPNSTLVEFAAGHNDMPGIGNDGAYWQQIERFIERATDRR